MSAVLASVTEVTSRTSRPLRPDGSCGADHDGGGGVGEQRVHHHLLHRFGGQRVGGQLERLQVQAGQLEAEQHRRAAVLRDVVAGRSQSGQRRVAAHVAEHERPEIGGHAQVARQHDVQPRGRVARARGDHEHAEVLGPDVGGGEGVGERRLAQGDRLGQVAAHALARGPARDVLDDRVDHAVPGLHPDRPEHPLGDRVAAVVRGEEVVPQLALGDGARARRCRTPVMAARVIPAASSTTSRPHQAGFHTGPVRTPRRLVDARARARCQAPPMAAISLLTCGDGGGVRNRRGRVRPFRGVLRVTLE